MNTRNMTDAQLLAICADFSDPRRDDASEELDARQNDDCARRTPVGGEA